MTGHSIHLRLVLAASLVLAAFLGLGGLALDKAYRESGEAALRERLLGYVYALLAAAEEDGQGRLTLPVALPDPRFSNPDSGLYAEVGGADGRVVWRSPSLLGRTYGQRRQVAAGVRDYLRYEDSGGSFNVLNFGVVWEDRSGAGLAYTLSVSEDARPLEREIAAFRTSLLIWLGGASLLLLIAQGVVLRWGLRPLREVADDIQQVERGARDYLAGRYPRELSVLTRRINSLLHSARASRDRYRHSMDDLAHSLKTPLAVLRGAVERESGEALRGLIREQVPRMDDIVQYQLKRAAAAGVGALSGPVPVGAVVRRLCASLEKVYREKGVVCERAVDEGLLFQGDEGDLFELLGNLIDNAFKYGRSRVRIRAGALEGGIRITIEDDGPGIAPDERVAVLRRGVRFDQRTAGQGIGLSVADDIARLYQGRIAIGASDLGGVAVAVDLS
ncbi:MAG: hypothetical protein B0D86_06840 [Candidatus Sedimenticola endophacoides]|nr:MAG: hypothetical protein B0D86_06840 [Candidatus Sedimenticola endophacoides]